MKYIDADILSERIKKNQYVIEPMFLKGDNSYYEGENDGYNRILDIIDSLQQEPEVDLEKEMNLWISENENIHHGDKLMVWLLKEVARHFYKLGKNSNDMTKAEEKALKAYPNLQDAEFNEMYPRLLFTRNTERSAFVKGYEQAEKDLALTWKDMRKIIRIDEEMMDDPEEHTEWKEEQPYYEEMLRRFNKAKED